MSKRIGWALGICCFCGKLRSDSRVSRWSASRNFGCYGNGYAGLYYAYHKHCLKETLCNPRKYPEKVYMAIQIADFLKERKHLKELEKIQMKKRLKENAEKAKKYCELFDGGI